MMLESTKEYQHLKDNVILSISEAKRNVTMGANAEIVKLNWRIGRMLDERSEWGSKYIDTLSKDIRTAFPGTKGFSVRSLKYMMKFAREFDEELCNRCCTIPWGHIMLILDKTEPGGRREWYLASTIQNCWSRAVLDHQLDLHLYERQAPTEKITNFSRTLPAPESELAQQALKDPYIFNFITSRQSLGEHEIENQMVDNVTKLLLELGTGFAFMGRQYHIAVGAEDFYIDLLFYNTRLRCYVVVELKNEKFKPEYAGKLSFYVTAVDELLTGDYDNPAIGLLLCKTKDDTVAGWSLRALDSPIGVSEYRLGYVLPGEYEKVLPSTEDLETRI